MTFKALRVTSWGSVLSFAANDCLTERTQAAITQPEVVKDFLCPLDSTSKEFVRTNRARISANIHSASSQNELFIITGPSSLSDSAQSKTCAQWIKTRNTGSLHILMNANVSHVKSHTSRAVSSGSTTVQPYFLSKGLVNTRTELLLLCNAGVGLVGCIDDPIAHVYFQDMFSMALVPHTGRTLVDVVSDGSLPVGFQCGNMGLKQVQKDCLDASKLCRSRLTIMNLGQVGIVTTSGNDDTFVILGLRDADENLHLNELLYDVKIMFDVGKVTSANYKPCLDLVKTVMRSQTLRPRLLGFIIDSGDYYTQETQEIYGDENDSPIEYNAFSEELSPSPRKSSMGNYMMKSLMSSYAKFSQSFRPRDLNVLLEPFFYADRLISDIDNML